MTYGRIGKGLAVRDEDGDSTVRVDLEELGVKVGALLCQHQSRVKGIPTDLGEDDADELNITLLEPSLGNSELGYVGPA
jgi:hypothetical protein